MSPKPRACRSRVIGYALTMSTHKDANRPEHNEAEERVKQEGQLSETSALDEPEPAGDADATDKSTGTVPDWPDRSDSDE